MAKKRIHAFISGRVQGVFFRDFTRTKARELNLSGWAKNLPDGRVEAVAEGEEKELKALIDWLHIGSPYSRVDTVDYEWEDELEGFKNFSLRY